MIGELAKLNAERELRIIRRQLADLTRRAEPAPHSEDGKLKKLLADAMLDNAALKDLSWCMSDPTADVVITCFRPTT